MRRTFRCDGFDATKGDFVKACKHVFIITCLHIYIPNDRMDIHCTLPLLFGMDNINLLKSFEVIPIKRQDMREFVG
jgi:hypothetical protein